MLTSRGLPPALHAEIHITGLGSKQQLGEYQFHLCPRPPPTLPSCSGLGQANRDKPQERRRKAQRLDEWPYAGLSRGAPPRPGGSMKLLTHNMLACHIKGVKENQPFIIEVCDVPSSGMPAC